MELSSTFVLRYLKELLETNNNKPENFHGPFTQFPPKVTSYMVIAQEVVTVCPDVGGLCTHGWVPTVAPAPETERMAPGHGLPPGSISADVQPYLVPSSGVLSFQECFMTILTQHFSLSNFP